MSGKYLSEFEGAYLEDSYFLGAYAEGDSIRFEVLFALTTEHTDYAPPAPGQAHYYRQGSIVVAQPDIVEWLPGKPSLTRDPDGTFDFGSIELYRLTASRYRFITDWFDATLEVVYTELHLKRNSR